MVSLLRKVRLRSTLVTAAIAAILFAIPVFFYIRVATYRGSWLLYLGSFLFFATIWTHTLLDSRKRHNDESTAALSFATHVVTIVGVAFSCILCFLLLVILVPGYLESGMAEKGLSGEPVNSIEDKTSGLSFAIFLAATFINFSVGSFTGIILPFAIKRNQTRDNRDPAPLHQQGTR